MACDHGAGSAEARTMKELVKMEKLPLVGVYINGDFEQFEDKDDLIAYMNHASLEAN